MFYKSIHKYISSFPARTVCSSSRLGKTEQTEFLGKQAAKCRQRCHYVPACLLERDSPSSPPCVSPAPPGGIRGTPQENALWDGMF